MQERVPQQGQDPNPEYQTQAATLLPITITRGEPQPQGALLTEQGQADLGHRAPPAAPHHPAAQAEK